MSEVIEDMEPRVGLLAARRDGDGLVGIGGRWRLGGSWAGLYLTFWRRRGPWGADDVGRDFLPLLMGCV